MKKVSNYELQLMEWRNKFLSMDKDDILLRLPEAELDGTYLKITHFSRRCGVSLKTGDIIDLENPSAILSMDEKLNIYTLFAYCKPGARLSGEWLPFAELRGASVFAPAFKKGAIDTLARTFSGRIDAFCRGCERLGGIRLAVSDAGYELKAFECIPLRFLFWDADDEFDAQANILFDKSATDFIHVESTVTIAGAGICCVAEAADVPLR